MMKNKEELKNVIYQLVTGTRNLEEYPAEESRYVANAFAEGEPCADRYREIFETENRLCERLGVENDPDVDMLADGFLEIMEIVSKKMFDYGMLLKEELGEPDSIDG